MQTLSEIRTILAERGLHPKKALGQNFLHDQNQLRRLLEAAEVGAGDLVLEVGPGTGTLTESLLERGCEVIACELDRDLAGILEDRLGDRITLIRDDCLADQRTLASAVEDALSGRRFSLVSNLPYGAASPLMSLLAARRDCLGQWVTIQREVADRLVAGPGSKAYGAPPAPPAKRDNLSVKGMCTPCGKALVSGCHLLVFPITFSLNSS